MPDRLLGAFAVRLRLVKGFAKPATVALGSCFAGPDHVLQRVIELMLPKVAGFIFEEVSRKWRPDFLARHKFGCRILERMIEHFPASSSLFRPLSEFLDALLMRSGELMFHAFATHVMQHILEHGCLDHKRVVVNALIENLERAAMDAHATGVLDKAFSFLPPEDQNALASQVLSSSDLSGMP